MIDTLRKKNLILSLSTGLDPQIAETFFKVFHENMNEAQNELKATISVNTSDTLSSGPSKGQDSSEDFGVSARPFVFFSLPASLLFSSLCF